MARTISWRFRTVGSERFDDQGGVTAGSGYVYRRNKRKKTRRPQRPFQRLRACDVGLTRHGAF
jgi:hypothetical protein